MPVPIFLSPALPSELLSYILDYHVHPTTLIICSSRSDFINALVEDIRSQTHQHETHDRDHRGSSPTPQGEERRRPQQDDSPAAAAAAVGDDKTKTKQREEQASMTSHNPLLKATLNQLATSRHIRVIYVPTVTHLRAYLSVFTPDDSRVAPPPPEFAKRSNRNNDNNNHDHHGRAAPHIVLYGLIAVHRDTSEWSAQGLGNTASALVDLAHRLSWQAVVIEPQQHTSPTSSSSAPGRTAMTALLREPVPILSGGARRLGPHSEDGAWTGRTVEIGRVLGRWFRFERAHWDAEGAE